MVTSTNQVRAAGHRVRYTLVRILLAAVTGSLAWWLAQLLFGQPAPIFAPIAAAVCLIDEPGVRGRRAFRLIGGVIVGVVVGEVLLLFLNTGPWQVGVATAVAMLLVATVSTNPLPILQSGIASLLVVGMSTPQAGFSRLFSSLLGGALALLVSQVLVTPSPLAMLSDAVRSALNPAARALRTTARALDHSDLGTADEALDIVRTGQRDFAAFDSARSSTREMVRHTVRGRRERRATLRLDRRVAGIDRVHTGAVLIARAAQELLRQDGRSPAWVGRSINDLAEAVEILAEDPRSAHHRHRAFELAERVRTLDVEGLSRSLTPLVTEIQLDAADLAAVCDPGGENS